MIREELANYLGKNYERQQLYWSPARLVKVKGTKTWRQFENTKDALYYHVWRRDQAWWIPHYEFFRDVVRPPACVLELHANIGIYGPRLVGVFEVSYADHKTRCQSFLKARLKAWGDDSRVFDLDADEIPQHDVVLAFDCVERYKDQWQFIKGLPALGRVVVLGLDSRTSDVAELRPKLDKHYPITNYRVVNNYVHLIAFRQE